MKQSKDGFTLVELLIVIAIIGILASTLVPNLLNARSRAVDVSAQSYLRDAYAIQAVHQLDNEAYTDDETVLLGLGMKPEPPGVTFEVVAANATGFCMTSTRDNGSGKTFFLTATGGLQDSDSATVCTTAQ